MANVTEAYIHVGTPDAASHHTALLAAKCAALRPSEPAEIVLKQNVGA